MGSKRRQDILLILSGLQKVANAAVTQEVSGLDRSGQKVTAIKNAVIKNISESSSSIDPNLLVKRSGLVLENSAYMTQALTATTINESIKHFGYEKSAAKTDNIRVDDKNFSAHDQDIRDLVKLAAEDELELFENDNFDDQLPPILELNPSVTSLDLIANMPDLTDRKELSAYTFVKKRRPKPKRVDIDEEESDFDKISRTITKPLLIEHKDISVERAEQLVQNAKAQKVPSTRLSRMATFGGLGISLGLGTVAEVSKRAIGLSPVQKSGKSRLDGSVILSEANAERIVETLCKVRGAALKIGQIISIQDDSLINSQVSQIFERVRQSADYMPEWQMTRVMVEEFGVDWRDKFQTFEDRPFAAASIGQVHKAVLVNGRHVAVKIQYPGVAKGIESDINNLLGILKIVNIVPEKLFINNVVDHMKIELAQECDYVREAECGRIMGKYLKPYPQYYVPEVIDELSGSQVFTSEFINGLTIDECVDLDQDTRDWIVKNFLVLLFTELFQFRYMQTDPNWANFLYNSETKQLGLLDFGATREYKEDFVRNYFNILDGAANNQPSQVLDYSIKLGFLTGYESKVMMDAHVESVMILATPFREDRIFDYGNQNTTSRMHELMAVMLEHRLCPPPSEIYSLHRKMSGLFLMATKLRARINCYPLWKDLADKFHEKELK